MRVIESIRKFGLKKHLVTLLKWIIKPLHLAIIFIVLALVTISGIYLYTFDADNKDPGQTDTDQNKGQDLPPVVDYKPEKLEDLLPEEKNATTVEQKVVIYNRIAAAYSAKNDFKSAANYLEKAVIADEAFAKQHAYVIGTTYEYAGNKTKAIEYYKVALQVSKSNVGANTSDYANSQIQSLETSIKRLGGTLE